MDDSTILGIVVLILILAVLFVMLIRNRASSDFPLKRMCQKPCKISFNPSECVGMFMWNLQSGRNTFSRELKIIYGLDPDLPYEEDIHNWSDLIHPDDREKTQAALDRAFKTGHYETEFRFILPRGEVKLIQACGTVIYDSNGVPRFLMGVNVDVGCQQLTKNKNWTPYI